MLLRFLFCYSLLLYVLDSEADGAWTCCRHKGIYFQDKKIYIFAITYVQNNLSLNEHQV